MARTFEPEQRSRLTVVMDQALERRMVWVADEILARTEQALEVRPTSRFRPKSQSAELLI